jgi:hypothetical protein
MSHTIKGVLVTEPTCVSGEAKAVSAAWASPWPVVETGHLCCWQLAPSAAQSSPKSKLHYAAQYCACCIRAGDSKCHCALLYWYCTVQGRFVQYGLSALLLACLNTVSARTKKCAGHTYAHPPLFPAQCMNNTDNGSVLCSVQHKRACCLPKPPGRERRAPIRGRWSSHCSDHHPLQE